MYNDLAAIYYMLLEQWSKGKLVARRPSLPTMLQPPRIVIDPSTAHPTAMVGSLLMEGGAMGPGEELRRSPIEITGEGGGGGRRGGERSTGEKRRRGREDPRGGEGEGEGRWKGGEERVVIHSVSILVLGTAVEADICDLYYSI